MFQFIITNIFVISLGVILYVAVRTLPRIEESGVPEKKNAWEKWLASGVPERLDRVLNGFLAKFLRKLKIFLLRADNAVTAQLKKVKSDGNGAQNKPSIDFKSITDKNNGEVDSQN